MTMLKIVQDRLKNEWHFPCHVVIKNVLAYGEKLNEIKRDLRDTAEQHEGVLLGYHYRNEATRKFHLKCGFKNEFHMLAFLEEIEDDFLEIQVVQGDEQYIKRRLHRKAWNDKQRNTRV